jgi:thioredoxin-like negative regulator of GroEL
LVRPVPHADADLDKLAEEFRGAFILVKLDTQEEQAIAAQFGIRSLPTVPQAFRDYRRARGLPRSRR